jgi:hypothetical protein
MTVSALATSSVSMLNKCNERVYPITKITPHHMAGVMTGKACAQMHANSSAQASANYYIGYDGDIASGVPEEYRAWTSSNWDNDMRAITIEVSNSVNAEPWTISDKAWNALVSLCKDICTRYGITLTYTGDSSGTLTEHLMFAATGCPGTYLHGRMAELAATVNKPVTAPKVVKDLTKQADNAIYRIYNPNNGDHILTLSYSEANNLYKAGWTDEQVAWISPAAGTHIYRVYNPNSGQHHYCIEKEADELKKAGWKKEGIAFSSAGSQPVYRLYNGNAGTHMFTASKSEKDTLAKAGWTEEASQINYE